MGVRSTAYRGNGYGLSSRKSFPTQPYANESDSEDIPTASQLLSRERSESVETNQDIVPPPFFPHQIIVHQMRFILTQTPPTRSVFLQC